MGSYLYISIERQWPNGHWSYIFEGPSTALQRDIVVVAAFGDGPREEWEDKDPRTYVPPERWREMQNHPECPWRLHEPYWVRLIDGKEFIDIVREKIWQKLPYGYFGISNADPNLECSPQLRAYAALVESLLNEGVPVQVWAWHSQ
jgi:hypothetical protein